MMGDASTVLRCGGANAGGRCRSTRGWMDPLTYDGHDWKRNWGACHIMSSSCVLGFYYQLYRIHDGNVLVLR